MQHAIEGINTALFNEPVYLPNMFSLLRHDTVLVYDWPQACAVLAALDPDCQPRIVPYHVALVHGNAIVDRYLKEEAARKPNEFTP